MRAQSLYLTTAGLVLVYAAALATAAFADPPIVSSPWPSSLAERSVTVQGTAPGATWVNVWTQVRDAQTGATLAEVPGLRHPVSHYGTFNVRIATPDVSFGQQSPVDYVIHVESMAGMMSLGESTVALSSSPMPMIQTCSGSEGPAPRIENLTADQCAGPNTDISGQTQPRQLVTIWTEVYDPSSNQLLRSIPGIRSYASEDGSFRFRIATPRVSIGPDTPLRYEVHARAERNGQCSPDLVIPLKWDVDECSTQARLP